MDSAEKSDCIGPESRPLLYLRDIHRAEGTPLVRERGSVHKREQDPHLNTTTSARGPIQPVTQG